MNKAHAGKRLVRYKHKPKKKSVGRPTVYRKIFAVRAAKLCRLGATDADLADFFGVKVRVINTWKKVHEGFKHALAAKEMGNENVRRSLYQRAVGFEFEDTDIRAVGGKIVKTQLIKQALPDPGCIALWLKNREPEHWRDVTRIAGVKDEPVELKVEDHRPLKDVPYERLKELAALAMPRKSEGNICQVDLTNSGNGNGSAH